MIRLWRWLLAWYSPRRDAERDQRIAQLEEKTRINGKRAARLAASYRRADHLGGRRHGPA